MADTKKSVIEATLNGPYLVSAPPPLTNSRGERVETKAVTALCRCGQSENKPYCDGTHAKSGFTSVRLVDGSTNRQDHYRGKSITLNDNRGVCAHAAFCTEGLGSVFKYGEEPWIDPDGAASEATIEQVKKCPSGALSYSVDGVEQNDYRREPGILIANNGPYVVVGGVELEDTANGQSPQAAEHYTLCRCGGSKNKPFCDGSHWQGFEDAKN